MSISIFLTNNINFLFFRRKPLWKVGEESTRIHNTSTLLDIWLGIVLSMSHEFVLDAVISFSNYVLWQKKVPRKGNEWKEPAVKWRLSEIEGAHNEIRRVSWMLPDPEWSPSGVELIFAFAQRICIRARGRSPVAMSAYVCVCEGGGRNGKLNQRISRIYRRAIPGYCKCTVSVTSCRIFLGNPVVAFPLFLSFSPDIPYEDRFVRKSSPPGITDLSTSFLGCLVTLPLFVIVPYLGQL